MKTFAFILMCNCDKPTSYIRTQVCILKKSILYCIVSIISKLHFHFLQVYLKVPVDLMKFKNFKPFLLHIQN